MYIYIYVYIYIVGHMWGIVWQHIPMPGAAWSWIQCMQDASRALKGFPGQCELWIWETMRNCCKSIMRADSRWTIRTSTDSWRQKQKCWRLGKYIGVKKTCWTLGAPDQEPPTLTPWVLEGSFSMIFPWFFHDFPVPFPPWCHGFSHLVSWKLLEVSIYVL